MFFETVVCDNIFGQEWWDGMGWKMQQDEIRWDGMGRGRIAWGGMGQGKYNRMGWDWKTQYEMDQ